MPVQFPPRSPVTHRPYTGDLGQRFQPAVDIPRLGGPIDPPHGFVQVAVVGDFVAGVHNPAHHVGVAFSRESGNEERGLDVLALQDLEQPGHCNLGPVGLVRHERHPAGAGGVVRNGA
ncbi:hypothetical protein D9M72_518630 [compost metagenome]